MSAFGNNDSKSHSGKGDSDSRTANFIKRRLAIAAIFGERADAVPEKLSKLKSSEVSNPPNCYAPSELRFYADYKGQRVNDGDYWLPNTLANDWGQKACPNNCYPVRISSLGIHYTQRCHDDDDYIEHSDGRTYYGSWESSQVHSEGVNLFLLVTHTSNQDQY
jgi:hypothetical protein